MRRMIGESNMLMTALYILLVSWLALFLLLVVNYILVTWLLIWELILYLFARLTLNFIHYLTMDFVKMVYDLLWAYFCMFIFYEQSYRFVSKLMPHLPELKHLCIQIRLFKYCISTFLSSTKFKELFHLLWKCQKIVCIYIFKRTILKDYHWGHRMEMTF